MQWTLPWVNPFVCVALLFIHYKWDTVKLREFMATALSYLEGVRGVAPILAYLKLDNVLGQTPDFSQGGGNFVNKPTTNRSEISGNSV